MIGSDGDVVSVKDKSLARNKEQIALDNELAVSHTTARLIVVSADIVSFHRDDLGS